MSTVRSGRNSALQPNKYSTYFNAKDFERNIKRLINQTWKLIPMRENKEFWQRQLESLIIEVVGLNQIFTNIDLLQILSKMQGLLKLDQQASFDLYRKTIFECISLFQEVNKNAI